MTEIVEKELSFKITGICFGIQNKHGRFLTERQYCDALEAAFKKAKLFYEREPALTVSYDGKEMYVGKPDFVVEGRMVLDAKSKKFITKEDYYQMMKYLSLLNMHLGMIINFRASHLKPKRIVNPSFFNSRHSNDNSRHSSRF